MVLYEVINLSDAEAFLQRPEDECFEFSTNPLLLRSFFFPATYSLITLNDKELISMDRHNFAQLAKLGLAAGLVLFQTAVFADEAEQTEEGSVLLALKCNKHGCGKEDPTPTPKTDDETKTTDDTTTPPTKPVPPTTPNEHFAVDDEETSEPKPLACNCEVSDEENEIHC